MIDFNERTGFTLIELLVVIAIIGILAAAAVPQVMDAICDARVSSVLSDLRTVEQATVQYTVNEGEDFWGTGSGGGKCNLSADCSELEDYLPEYLWKGGVPDDEPRLRFENDHGTDDQRRIAIDIPNGCGWVDDDDEECVGGLIVYNIDTGHREGQFCD